MAFKNLLGMFPQNLYNFFYEELAQDLRCAAAFFKQGTHLFPKISAK